MIINVPTRIGGWETVDCPVNIAIPGDHEETVVALGLEYPDEFGSPISRPFRPFTSLLRRTEGLGEAHEEYDLFISVSRGTEASQYLLWCSRSSNEEEGATPKLAAWVDREVLPAMPKGAGRAEDKQLLACGVLFYAYLQSNKAKWGSGWITPTSTASSEQDEQIDFCAVLHAARLNYPLIVADPCTEAFALITVHWGLDIEVSIGLSQAQWEQVKSGQQLSLQGHGYHYEGLFFWDYWHFSGGTKGALLVKYGEDGGVGFDGTLSDADIQLQMGDVA
ncbi:hypothetical protein [Fodinicurvata fenggangensis]|uniref:hypothetical protein n=1 Tax=Fodinicurvata fenggangensis TaxID=1121830 RepID=UPI0004789AB2|nr:hypothetical protein [Fodinicurvata fenggangensis]